MEYDTDFKRLIPPLSKEEHDLLEKSILQDGCRDAIVVWIEPLSNGEQGRAMILDGHNRYEICKKKGIQFEVIYEKLKDMQEARIWIIQNQLGRRNITSYQRGKLTLELKTMIQEKAKAKQREGGKEKGSQKSVEPPIDTQKELAKLAGVSHDTIHKIEVIEKEALPEIKDAVSSGKISINRAFKEVKERAVPQKSVERRIIGATINKDSNNLSQLKFYWGQAGTGDRKKFRVWLRSQSDRYER